MRIEYQITANAPKDYLRRLKHEISCSINENCKNDRELIYHYTSASTLPLILNYHNTSNNVSQNKMCLRFTDYRFLNDTSEGVHFLNQVRIVNEEMYASHYVSTEVYNAINQLETTFLNENDDLYVACFCSKEDHLPMWNYYLKDGKCHGYSIGFSFPFVSSEKDSVNVCKIIYDEVKQQKLIKNIILLVDSYKEQISLDEMVELLKATFRRVSLVMKSNYFDYEEEVRIIIDKKLALKCSKSKYDSVQEDEMILSLTDVDYYIRNGVYVHYIDVLFGKNDFLKSIMIAPTMDKKAAEAGVRLLMQKYNYSSDIEIKASNIPLRNT